MNTLITTSLILLSPILLIQGWRTRRTTPVLPEAGPPFTGLVEGANRSGIPLRLVVLGESTAAGVGACSHEKGMAGQFAGQLARRTGLDVAWRAVGRSGATARQTVDELTPQLAGADGDLALVLLGVNDAIRLTGPNRWRRDLLDLIDEIHRHLGPTPILLAGPPPLSRFPALPQPLRTVMGWRSTMLDGVAAEIAAATPGVIHVSTPLPGPDQFARDGFHPGPVGYANWAEVLADALLGDKL